MTLTELGITISAQEHASSTLGKVTGYFGKLKKEIQGAWKEGEKLNAVTKSMAVLGNVALGGGIGLGAALGFKGMAEDGAKAEHSLAQLGNIANLTKSEVGKLGAELLSMSGRTNQTQAELIGGLTALMGRGLGKSQAMALIEIIGKTATATGASVEDLSKTAYTAVSTLKMPVTQIGQLFDSLATAGKEGSFELKDMAKSMPELAAKAANLGMTGHKAAVQLAAWGQIAKMGTDDPSVAANNLANFLDKVTGKEAVKSFASHGIDLRKATSEAWTSGDFIGTMLQIIRRDTKGDTFKLNELFGDLQVKNFLAPALQNLDRYKEIAAKSLGAKGVVNQDYGRMMDTFSEKAKKLRVELYKAFVPQLGPWMDKASSMLGWLTARPKLFSGAINTAIGLFAAGVTFKLAAFTLGPLASATKGLWIFGRAGFSAGKDLAYCLRNASSLREGFSLFSQLKLPSWLSADVGGLFGKLASGTKSFTIATWGTVKALWAQAAAWAMTPFGMITIGVVALAGAGIWLWKNWDKVCTWFKTAWAWFQGLWTKVPGWVKWMFPFIQVPMLIIQNWAKVKGFLSGTWDFIKTFAKGFYEAGKIIVEMLWKGIKAYAMLPVTAFKAIVSRIRNFLPFSPAKEGPLQDIHRIRLVETLAEGIKPGPILGRMGQLTRAMLPTLALGAAAGINLTINVSVQGGPAAIQDVKNAVLECVPEIEKALARRGESKQRRTF